LVSPDAWLESGQRALSAGRWEDARDSFEAALAVEETPEAHEGVAWAAVWTNEGDAAIAAFDHAHRLYLARDERRGAARVAGWLAWCYGSFRGQYAVAAGWGERAQQLLQPLEPGPEHAWLAAFGGMTALRSGDTAAALELARAAVGVARSLRRPDLEAMGLALEGEALVAEGAFAEGLRLLDGAAAMAIGSGSDDFACVTTTCCSMLAACKLAADVERASQWCDVTTEYALRYGMRNIFAICRTSYAGVLIACGRWKEAEAELVRAAREFAEVRPGMPSQATARLAELRRRQGRFAEAAELFAQVEGRRDAVLGCAALALVRGDAERAGDLAERFLRQTPPATAPGARSGWKCSFRLTRGKRSRRRPSARSRSCRPSPPRLRPIRSALAPGSRRERSRAREATWLPRAVTSRTPSTSSRAAGCRSRPRTRGLSWPAPFAARGKRPPRERRRRPRGRRSRSWAPGMALRSPRGCWPVSMLRGRTEALRNPSQD
jgi:tetratricopeptide (TPR) repeat protein